MQTQKIQEEDAGKKYYILGWMPCKFNNMVLLQDTTDREKYKIVFANTKTEKILNYFKSSFFTERDPQKYTNIFL